MRIGIDREACVGCGRCSGLLPDLIEMDADQRARLLPGAGEGDPQRIVDAVLSCPAGALSREN